MLPSTFVGLLLFLWLVTPGFVFNWAANRRRVLPTQTTFQEVSRVVVASAAFSTLAGLIVVLLDVLLGRLSPNLGISLNRVLTVGRPYLAAHAGGVAAYLLLQVAAGCGLALGANRVIRWHTTKKRGGEPPPKLRAESAWVAPFERRPAGASPHAWVRLKSGVELRGTLAVIGHDIPIADRELVLTMPLHIRPPGGQLQELQWQWVIVQGPDIDALAVKYVRDAAAPADKPAATTVKEGA